MTAHSLLKQMQSIELNKLHRKSATCCARKALKMSAQQSLTHFNLIQHLSMELNKLCRKSAKCCAGKARGATLKMSTQTSDARTS